VWTVSAREPVPNRTLLPACSSCYPGLRRPSALIRPDFSNKILHICTLLTHYMCAECSTHLRRPNLVTLKILGMEYKWYQFPRGLQRVKLKERSSRLRHECTLWMCMSMTDFWDIAPGRFVEVHRRFRGACCPAMSVPEDSVLPDVTNKDVDPPDM
jgi:hypothetical protein